MTSDDAVKSAPEPHLSPGEVERLARRAHALQTDKAGKPYVEHLASVAHGVATRGGSDEQIAAAWLHDAVEDGVLSREWLAGAALPDSVKVMVLAMTKEPDESLDDYAGRLLGVPGALLIKEADIAHNSDPDRLSVLDSVTRDRLTEKYARMRRLLGLDEG
ncbi:HD domain-containing protein [Streptomyces sp. NPDC051322]|uniref:HD domain-containing protein n=1 Tax=Streptomyces sp. NPDC051322 TaxID=3154645 RepID=UPI00344BFA89